LHTTDAVESLTRLMSYFQAHQHPSLRQMLAHTLKAVVSQRLVQKIDGKGLVAAIEILIANATVREIIQKADHFDSLYTAIAGGSDTYGMQSFDDHLLELYNNGIIAREEALAQATRRDDMLLKMRGVGVA
jgi:twitching motility protein PilT